MNSFAPNANALHYPRGILFQMIINVENRSCWLWAGIIEPVRSMASIMGLLMVPDRSRTFLIERRWAERQATVVGRQPHLWPPEAASGLKEHQCPSQSIARALRWPSLRAQAPTVGWRGTHGTAVGMALLPHSSRLQATGKGASRHLVLWTPQKLASPHSTLGHQWEEAWQSQG